MTLLSPSLHVTDGQDVALLSMPSELTVAQAAKILAIPESDLIELLDSGEVAFRTISNRRAVSVASLLDYNRETSRLQNEALDELTQQAQEWGVY